MTLVILAALVLSGCAINDKVYVDRPDRTAPGVPRGVSSITGDQAVTIVWLGSTEPDMRAYIVYRNDNTSDNLYNEIGRVFVDGFQSQWSFVDHNVVNGRTYLYAVSAIDNDDNESELSYEDVHDTPRPAGTNVFADATQNLSGYDFSAEARVPFNSSDADIKFTYDNDLQTLFVESAGTDVDVQDFGFTQSLDDLDWAPQDGWSSVGWCELIVGHAYVVWTGNDHYAKLRVTQVSGTALHFDWAYQIDPGNPELKRAVTDSAIVKH
jgi:hypothetical protein